MTPAEPAHPLLSTATLAAATAPAAGTLKSGLDAGCLGQGNRDNKTATFLLSLPCSASAAYERWAPPAAGTTGAVALSGTSLCMSATDVATSVVFSATCSSSKSVQQFTFTSAGQLKTKSGLCVTASKVSWGTRVTIAKCDDGVGQRWTYVADAVSTTTPSTGTSTGTTTSPSTGTTTPTTGTTTPTTGTGTTTTVGTTTPTTPVSSTPVPVVNVVLPELPRLLDAAAPAVTGTTRYVPAGGNLQAALDAARPGDVITLENGATYTGNFLLPAKAGMTAAGGGWITIRPASSAGLPAAGTRVDPARHAAAMPKLVAPNGASVVRTAPGAAGWYLEGLEIAFPTTIPYGQDLVQLGDGSASTVAEMPARVTLARVYLHGSPGQPVKRGVLANGAAIALVDSYVTEIHVKGQETHGFMSWAGPGPFKVVNNTIEAAGIGVFFGGADPKVVGLSPSDIEVRGNHIRKPLAWKGLYTVKNGFECKNCKRALVEGNVLENTWADAQIGYMIQLTALSDNNTAPWATVCDVTVRYNVFRNAPGGINISSRAVYPNKDGSPGVLPSEPGRRFLVANNVFDHVAEPDMAGAKKLFQISGDLEHVTIEHNTGSGSTAFMVLAGSSVLPKPYMTGLVVRDNVFGRGTYGLFGDGASEGTVAMTRYAPDGLFAGNLVYGTTGGAANPTKYPANNSFAASASAAGLVSGGDGLLELSGGSTFRTAGLSGALPGADLARVRQLAATAMTR